MGRSCQETSCFWQVQTYNSVSSIKIPAHIFAETVQVTLHNSDNLIVTHPHLGVRFYKHTQKQLILIISVVVDVCLLTIKQQFTLPKKKKKKKLAAGHSVQAAIRLPHRRVNTIHSVSPTLLGPASFNKWRPYPPFLRALIAVTASYISVTVELKAPATPLADDEWAGRRPRMEVNSYCSGAIPPELCIHCLQLLIEFAWCELQCFVAFRIPHARSFLSYNSTRLSGMFLLFVAQSSYSTD